MIRDHRKFDNSEASRTCLSVRAAGASIRR
jgi:hypothetical protein